MVGYKALNTRRKYRKTEQLSVFLYFHLSQLRSLKGTKKKEISIGNFLLLFRASCRIRTNDPEITNHVLWPTELKRRVGKLLTSRRYNQLPLLRSRPGGFEGSWPCKTAHVIDLRKQAFQGVKTKRSQCYC